MHGGIGLKVLGSYPNIGDHIQKERSRTKWSRLQYPSERVVRLGAIQTDYNCSGIRPCSAIVWVPGPLKVLSRKCGNGRGN